MKIAICGAWHVHATDFIKIALEEKAEILGIYDENAELRHSLAEKFGLHEFLTLDELLDSDADGVAVASSTDLHTEHMIKIANAKKDIFTEKVLALTEEECLAVKKAVEDNGVRFVISFVQKRVGTFIRAKEIVDSGEIGKINYLRFRNCHNGSMTFLPQRFYNRKQCGGGAMIDLGAHGMYITEWFLGMPKDARSTFTIAYETEKNVDNVEDNAVTVMSFDNGAIAVNETGFVSLYSPMTLEIGGEEGRIYAEAGCLKKACKETGGKLVDVEPYETGLHPLRQFIRKEVQDGIGIDEAVKLTKMMEMAYKN
jgi:predicted dehydrogenase